MIRENRKSQAETGARGGRSGHDKVTSDVASSRPLRPPRDSDEAPRLAPPWRWKLHWLWLLLGLNLIWRTVRYALNFPLWGDEAMLAMSFIDRSWTELLQPLEHAQVAPIGFLFAVHGLTQIGGLSPWVLRAVPFVAGVVSLLLLARLAREVLPRRAALLSVAVFAASYYPVRHASEVKPYATDLAWAAAIWLVAWHVAQAPNRLRLWCVFAAMGAAGIWFSYPAAFVAGGMELFLIGVVLRRREPRVLWPWLATGAVFAGSLAAVVGIVGQGQADSASAFVVSTMWQDAFVPIERPWEIPWWLLKIHAGRMLAYPFGGPNFGSAATLALCIYGGIRLARWCPQGRQVLGLLLAPVALALIASALQKYPYGLTVRTSLYLAPPICLLAGEGLRGIVRYWAPRIRPRTFTMAVCTAAAMIIVAGVVRDVTVPHKTAADAQTREIVQRFVSGLRSGDVVVISNPPHEDRRYQSTLHGGGLTLAPFVYMIRTQSTVPVLLHPDPDQIQASSQRLIVIRHDTRNDALRSFDLPAYESALGASRIETEIVKRAIDDQEFIRWVIYE